MELSTGGGAAASGNVRSYSHPVSEEEWPRRRSCCRDVRRRRSRLHSDLGWWSLRYASVCVWLCYFRFRVRVVRVYYYYLLVVIIYRRSAADHVIFDNNNLIILLLKFLSFNCYCKSQRHPVWRFPASSKRIRRLHNFFSPFSSRCVTVFFLNFLFILVFCTVIYFCSENIRFCVVRERVRLRVSLVKCLKLR